MDTGKALRETSDALLRDLDVLVTMEEEKRLLEPDDPRRVELAGRIEEIARRILAGTADQHHLTKVAEAQVSSGAPHAPDEPIEDTPRAVHAVLSDWRDAERRAAAAEPGSTEAIESRALVDRLRLEYRQALDSASRRP